MPACQVVPPSTGFTPSILGFLDCQARTLGAQGFQSLASPGSPAAVILGSALALFIAFFGYRLLLGHQLTIGDGVVAAAKVGIVLTLATSFPAYKILVYDVVLRSPAELVSSIGASSDLPGSRGDMAGRLDAADQAFQSLAIYGVGSMNPIDQNQAQSQISPAAPQLWVGFDTFALGMSRAMFLVGAIGAFAFLHLTAGLLLAVGPIFACFMLFQSTRGLFEGWLRGLLTVIFGATATAIALGVELSLLEPWLADLLARRSADAPIIGEPARLIAVTTVFTIVLATMIGLMSKIAFSLRIPAGWREWATTPSSSWPRERVTSTASTGRAEVPAESRSRAVAIADAVVTSQRREAARFGRSEVLEQARSGAAASQLQAAGSINQPSLGKNISRRTSTRASRGASTRDLRK